MTIDITLPDFVTFVEEEPYYRIRTKNGMFYIEDSETTQGMFFELPSLAYRYIQKTLKGKAFFSKEDVESAGEMMGGIFLETQKLEGNVENTKPLLISHDVIDRVEFLKAEYAYFLKLDMEYKNNPENWALAYKWVETHPAFWHRLESNPNNWEIQSGWKACYTNVYYDEVRGEHTVTFEHGPYVDELEFFLDDDVEQPTLSRVVSSHDTRLDIAAASFEEAYVAFAKAVAQNFDNHGNDIGEKNDEELTDEELEALEALEALEEDES